MIAWIQLLRPMQWSKNLIVLAGLLFSQNLTDKAHVLLSLGAFIAFCLGSSSMYIFNDIVDREKDREHPRKKNRPIAAGRISPLSAAVLSFILAVAALSLAFLIKEAFFFILLLYMVVTISYTVAFKQVVILDVVIIALGFVLRAVGGTVVIQVPLSPWLLLCAFLLSLFLALGKRRHELVFLGETGAAHRAILGEYTPVLLDQMISVVTSSTLVCYCLYTISDRTRHAHGSTDLMYTIPLVLFGIMRYLYLIYREDKGGSPEQLMLQDIPLLCVIVLWMVAVVLILYRSTGAA